MNILPPPCTHGKVNRWVIRLTGRLSALLLTFTGLLLTTSNVHALRHPPIVSWIPDQRVVSGGSGFSQQSFTVTDLDDPIGVFTPQYAVSWQSPAGWTNGLTINIAPCSSSCPPDGNGYTLSFSGTPTAAGVATIVIKAKGKNSGGKTGYTSFTLRVDPSGSGDNPPQVQSIPNISIGWDDINGAGTAQFLTNIIVGDLDEDGNEDIGTNSNPKLHAAVDSSDPTVLDPGELSIELLPPSPALSYPDSGPRVFQLKGVTETNAQTLTTPVTVTVHITDEGDGTTAPLTTSTSFVFQVFNDTSNVPPTFSNAPTYPTYLQCPSPTPSTLPAFTYHVQTNEVGQSTTDLRVSATSSNTVLVPNNEAHLSCGQPQSDGTGIVSITPVLPLVFPGVPQAATIVLTVSDDQYSRQSSFLYVVEPRDSNGKLIGYAGQYRRPTGVYNLDPLPIIQQRDYDFLTGEMHRVSWNKAEPTNGDPYQWTLEDGTGLDDVIDNLPEDNDLDLSLNLIEEPCYIGDLILNGHTTVTWCDTNAPKNMKLCTQTCSTGVVRRAVPWDQNLRDRRNAFLQAAAHELKTTDRISKVSIINTNLPGADTGIREADGKPFSASDEGPSPHTYMPGYTRDNLLFAIEDELRHVQDLFLQDLIEPGLAPGPVIQMGFFTAADDEGPGGDHEIYDTELWQWLYPLLQSEFDGIKRPRVHFFQEDLAAARMGSGVPNYVTPPTSTAYSFTPNHCQVPAFAYSCVGTCVPSITCNSDDSYFAGMAFQANTPWSSPFTSSDGDKLAKTLNGSPNDGMEAAFNTYLNQYLEVYPPDIDHALPTSGPLTTEAVLWQGELKSWHDYCDYLRTLAPIEGPAGLLVTRASTVTATAISWYAVPGATSYELERKDLLAPSQIWVAVTGYDGESTSFVDNHSSLASAYRVRALDDNGGMSTWSDAALFFSDGDYDGYVQNMVPNQAYPNEPQPGIHAGQVNTSGTRLWDGFLSFPTNLIGSTTTILGAKLRLYQTYDNGAFAVLGNCKVDIKKGTFNGINLTASDFTALETDPDVMRIPPAQSLPGWVVADLDPAYKTDINNTTSGSGRTQFRIYFDTPHSVLFAPLYAGWNSGESTGNEPELIVRYTEP